ncbi:MAG: hypothetical protein NZ849_11460 [Meiothermus sp.]|uniref:hypothetical protein n=1 Tax=Meiothermus sp. TaxID=1955249 RepID=UPI0025DBFB6C|nr:hypothetical protein [Meiothermus sp.]MCS7059120.1 hypothetical protein [Meiothermus sp.]MCS7195508.1 hypothetical protein [Meiothermus sp.]MCX7741593.1 hypothetical protein [Meiothermus sp.]MDW8090436.1 hypothetical protein [Meiothermus sp.]MDW8481063.1 hypothetical protein [Meiothermus sp.]
MSPWLSLGLALYLANLMVGLLAQLGLGRFGVWHHLLYLGVFVSAAAALLLAREPWLLLTVACLGVFPKARPHTWLHPTLAAVGLVGYLLAAWG